MPLGSAEGVFFMLHLLKAARRHQHAARNARLRTFNRDGSHRCARAGTLAKGQPGVQRRGDARVFSAGLEFVEYVQHKSRRQLGISMAPTSTASLKRKISKNGNQPGTDEALNVLRLPQGHILTICRP
jgi:hypothetical protein